MNQTEPKKLSLTTLLLILAVVILFAGGGAALILLQPAYKANEDLAVIPAQFEMDGVPTRVVSAPFKIHNNTNAPLDLQLDVKLPENWIMFGEIPEMTLESGEFGDVFVGATIPFGTESGKYHITVSAINKDVGDLFDSDQTQINVISVAIPKVRIGNKRQSGSPTETLQYEVELINNGNKAQDFNLSLSETPTGWRTHLSQDTINVSPGQSQIATVSIDIPFGAPETLHIIKFHAKNGDFEDTLDLHVEVVQPN